jgi:hypothetical protein
MMRILTALFVSFTLVAPIAGCRLGSAYEILAQQAADSVDSVQSESAMLIAATEGADPDMSGSEAAAASVEHAHGFFRPAGCLVTTVSGSTAVYALDDCTGPYGLAHVTGTVTVEYSRQGDGLGYVASTQGLDVNSATVDFENHGVYTRTGTTHELRGSVSGTAIGPRGHVLTREGERTFTWDSESECMALEGDWVTAVDGRSWTTEVRALEKCVHRCPADGGTVVWTSDRDSLRFEFDGTAAASWSTDSGKTGTVDLTCL